MVSGVGRYATKISDKPDGHFDHRGVPAFETLQGEMEYLQADITGKSRQSVDAPDDHQGSRYSPFNYQASAMGGCFYCHGTYQAVEITDWVDRDYTALGVVAASML